MASDWIPVLAALGGAAVGAGGTALPAYLEHKRQRARDEWERADREAVRRNEELHRVAQARERASAVRLEVITRAVVATADYLADAQTLSGNADHARAREALFSAWAQARLVATYGQQFIVDEMLQILTDSDLGVAEFHNRVRQLARSLASLSNAEDDDD